MSNRGRQNVASFLTQNLNVDWRLGAAYFEEVLNDVRCLRACAFSVRLRLYACWCGWWLVLFAWCCRLW